MLYQQYTRPMDYKKTSNLVLPKPADIRGARAYLNWTQMQLAYLCHVNIATINSIENEKSKPSKELLEQIAKVFDDHNIKFIETGGHIFNKDIIKIYEGLGAYSRALKNIYQYCLETKTEILMLGNDDERSNEEVNNIHKKYYPLGVPVKYLIDNENDYILGPINEYRKIDKKLFLSKDVTLIYEGGVLFFAEEEGNLKSYELTKVKIIVIQNPSLAEQFKAYFYRLWNDADLVKESSIQQILFR